MVNIPPLLSSTPPPIEDDTDDGSFPNDSILEDDHINIDFNEISTPSDVALDGSEIVSDLKNNMLFTDEPFKEINIPSPFAYDLSDNNFHIDENSTNFLPTSENSSDLPIESKLDDFEKSELSDDIEIGSHSVVIENIDPESNKQKLTSEVSLEDVSDEESNFATFTESGSNEYEENNDDFFAIKFVDTTNPMPNISQLGQNDNCDMNLPEETTTEKLPEDIFSSCTNQEKEEEEEEEQKSSDLEITKSVEPNHINIEITTSNLSQPQPQEEENPTDDDFGDFEEASFVEDNKDVANKSEVQFNNRPAIAIADSNTFSLDPPKLKSSFEPILNLMFPNISSLENEDSNSNTEGDVKSLSSIKTSDILLGSIDCACALKYQWKESRCRCALIKSLGIDARSIHFGEKWSKPIYASGLSILPLKPLHYNNSYTPNNDVLKETPNTALNKEIDNTIDTRGMDIHGSHIISNDSLSKTDVDILAPQVVSKESITSTTDATLTNKQSQLNNSSTGNIFESRASSNLTDDIKNVTLYDTKNMDLQNIDMELSRTPFGHNSNMPENFYKLDNLSKPLYSKSEEITVVGENVLINQNSTFSSDSSSSTQISEVALYGKSDEDIDVVVVTSTYSGPFKESHIYTPPTNFNKAQISSAVSTIKPELKQNPIDFDYETASAGIIIDETVVRKEYRDVEYNPEFEMVQTNGNSSIVNSVSEQVSQDLGTGTKPIDNELEVSNDWDEGFSEFQSAPSNKIESDTIKGLNSNSDKLTPQHCSSATDSPNKGIILCPAVLIPNKTLTTQTPRLGGIEWGNSKCNINAEEILRIEKLFSNDQAKQKMETSNSPNNLMSQMLSSPKHLSSISSKSILENDSLSISARIAEKEKNQTIEAGTYSNAADDDDWSDFVSVPPSTNSHNVNINSKMYSNTQNLFQTSASLLPTPTPTYLNCLQPVNSLTPTKNSIGSHNTDYDDEWTDFVSSNPPVSSSSTFSSVRNSPSIPASQAESSIVSTTIASPSATASKPDSLKYILPEYRSL